MHFATGQIGIWSGAIVDIPAGWLLCDGNNGTPDLRNRFVVGSGDTYVPDETGGANSHTHTFTSGTHRHQFTMDSPRTLDEEGGDVDDRTNFQAESGTTDSDSNLPPYHALAYIMKD